MTAERKTSRETLVAALHEPIPSWDRQAKLVRHPYQEAEQSGTLVVCSGDPRLDKAYLHFFFSSDALDLTTAQHLVNSFGGYWNPNPFIPTTSPEGRSFLAELTTLGITERRTFGWHPGSNPRNPAGIYLIPYGYYQRVLNAMENDIIRTVHLGDRGRIGYKIINLGFTFSF